jgi:quercetin dioxygenase-like cupin family protein
MPERGFFEEVDKAVDNCMEARDIAQAPPAVTELLAVAGKLCRLPEPSFRARLKADLAARAHGLRVRSAGGSQEEIQLALEEMAARPPFVPYDVNIALRALPEMSMRLLAAMGACTIGVSRFSQSSHWERHPAADELLYLLDGDMDVTTLTADGPLVSIVRAGSVFVCPRGLWHRIDPRSPLSLLSVTPGEGTEHSAAERPPTAPSTDSQASVGAAQDVRAVLADVRSLRSTAADAAFHQIAMFNQSVVSVGRFRGLTPWERHRGGDELLHLLQGEVEITVLTDDGLAHRRLGAGDVFVCPQGLWHRQLARETVTGLYATPRPGDISWADDPRTGPVMEHD